MNEHMKANTRRVPLYTWGLTKHPSGDFVVDDAFYAALKEFHIDMSKRGYYSPFAANHESDGPEHESLPASAKTYGRVVDVIKTDRGIDIDLYFAEGYAEAYDKGLLDSFSPTHYTRGFTDPHTGKHYKTGLREVSAVRVRHQKNLPGASPWYQMNAEAPEWRPITALEEHMTTATNTPATPQQQAPPTTQPQQQQQATTQAPTLEQRFEALAQANEAMKAESAETKKTLEEILAKLNPPQELTTNGEETPDQKRLRELEQKLAQQDRELKLANARAKISARLPGAPAEQITSLSEMALTVKPDALEHVLKPLEEAAKSKLTTNPPGITILGEQGSVGGPAGGMTMAKAKEEATAAGIKAGPERLSWIKARYPNLV
jgi:hypothetical protein